MKVIGAGFGRTGTYSLKTALEMLGISPCYHMVEVFQHPDGAAVWEAAAEGKPADFNRALEGYEAAVDWPSCAFYAQLMEVYPDAKVILTLRDPERWYDSVCHTIYRAQQTEPNPGTEGVRRMIRKVIWEGTFDGRFEDKEHALAVFNRHIEEVRHQVPKDRLLVFQVKEGWEPLCRFLGVDVPSGTPFPHTNTKEEWAEQTLVQRLAQQRT